MRHLLTLLIAVALFVPANLVAQGNGAPSGGESPNQSKASGGYRNPPFELPPSNELRRMTNAVLETSKGDIFFDLFPDQAPWHVANLKYLSDLGFYRNSRFHDLKANFLLQGGLADESWKSRVAYSLPAEFNSLSHEFGALGMARRVDEINPERRSLSTQFHILLIENPRMDGNYTTFGRVVAGTETLKKIKSGDRILDFKVYLSP